jgi:hypothetical protein
MKVLLLLLLLLLLLYLTTASSKTTQRRIIGWYVIINRKDVDGTIPNHDEEITKRGKKDNEEIHEKCRIFKLLQTIEL